MPNADIIFQFLTFSSNILWIHPSLVQRLHENEDTK